jgi:hypothetical protein
MGYIGMTNCYGQKWWDDNWVLERLTRAYSREDDYFQTCTLCGDIARQQSVSVRGDVKRELRCTNCSHMERTTVVKTTKTGIEVTALPFECHISTLNSTGEQLAAWLLWYDRYQELSECQQS